MVDWNLYQKTILDLYPIIDGIQTCVKCDGMGHDRVGIPCPDGIRGCAVFHFKKIPCEPCEGKGYIKVKHEDLPVD